MKYPVLLFMIIPFAACNSNQTLQTKNSVEIIAPKQQAGIDSATLLNSSRDTATNNTNNFTANKQIIPGESIGNAVLSMNADSLQIIFGKADLSDAAMGKAWITWFGKKPDERNNKTRLDIYTTYKDTSMRERTVQQIRTTSSYFNTEKNIHVYSSLDEIKAAYPNIKKLEQSPENEKILLLFDDVNDGIAFQVSAADKKTCTGIFVHPKGKTARDVYLDIPQQ